MAQVLVLGKSYDVLVSDSKGDKRFDDLVLLDTNVNNREELMVFQFRDGHQISIGVRFIIRIE